jgi:putative transposase
VHLASRRGVHVAATAAPDAGVDGAATAQRDHGRGRSSVLLRDRDGKFGPAFDGAAQGVGAKVIRTAVRAPNMNAVAERFVGSARRELLDHVLLVDDQHLASVLRQYQRYFNAMRARSVRSFKQAGRDRSRFDDRRCGGTLRTPDSLDGMEALKHAGSRSGSPSTDCGTRSPS